MQIKENNTLFWVSCWLLMDARGEGSLLSPTGEPTRLRWIGPPP